jgi:hypothetical protein
LINLRENCGILGYGWRKNTSKVENQDKMENILNGRIMSVKIEIEFSAVIAGRCNSDRPFDQNRMAEISTKFPFLFVSRMHVLLSVLSGAGSSLIGC